MLHCCEIQIMLMRAAGERLGNWVHVPCDLNNFSGMSLVQCPRGRELPCLSRGPKQCTALQESPASCQLGASELAGTELMSSPLRSPGTSMHQLGSQAWPAPHCQGENFTKCQEVSDAVLPKHVQGTTLSCLLLVGDRRNPSLGWERSSFGKG